MAPARSYWYPLLICILAAFSAMAQDGIDGSQKARDISVQPTATDAIEVTAQPVEVSAPARDLDIAARLLSILKSTRQIQAPTVEVNNGVVILGGLVAEAEQRTWAAEVARKTEDVVAVMNKIQVLQPSAWSLTPARREIELLFSQVVGSLPLFALGLVVLVVTLFFARGIARLSCRVIDRRVTSALLRSVLEKVLFIAVVMVGLYLFLRISGLTQLAVTVVGGTGIVGLVLGFAFRDIAENFLASVLISMQKPFRLGDTIEVDGHAGVVQRVTIRGTVLLDFDGNHIQIANATVYKSTIKNYTANPKLRADFLVGIGYDSSIVQAQGVVMAILQAHSAVLDEPEPTVLVEELSPSTVNLRIYFWIDGHAHSKLKVRSALMRLVVRGLDEAGVSMPDDAREVIFPQGVPIVDSSGLMSAPARESVPEPPGPPRRKIVEQRSEATEAEGDLSSEVKDIEQQARVARAPEEGGDLLTPN